MHMSNPLVSIIAPVYNEEDSIAEFVSRVEVTIAQLNDKYDFEVVLVDDGSDDGSLEQMKTLSHQKGLLKVVELRRNYGQTAALQAGLDAAAGSVLITMDADLQHFPEEIPGFLQGIENGYDMVCGWRHERAEGVVRKWPSRVANFMIRKICKLEIHDFGTTYRAYRAEIVKELRLFGEFHRYIPALGQDIGARIKEIPIKNVVRPAGESSYGIGRTFGVFLDLILLFFFVRYMDRPMRIFGKLAGIVFAIGCGILGSLVIYAYLCDIHAVTERAGWFLLSIMLILAAVQIILSGILAEILARIHYSQGNRRVYRVRNEW
jgi:glycosyltransferase involved in cell wall biosynthesis